MKPVGDYIFIEQDEIPEETESGLIIPKSALQREGAATGTISALGPETKGFKVGQSVVFNEHQYDSLFYNKDTKKNVLVGKAHGIYAIHA